MTERYEVVVAAQLHLGDRFLAADLAMGKPATIVALGPHEPGKRHVYVVNVANGQVATLRYTLPDDARVQRWRDIPQDR